MYAFQKRDSRNTQFLKNLFAAMRVICVYNNQEILRAGLLASSPAFLQRAKLTLLDNTQGRYASMAEAIQDAMPIGFEDMNP